MKLDTRIELTMLVVGAVLVGVWVGLRMVRSDAPDVKPEAPAASRSSSVPAPRIMTAPPARAPRTTPAPEPQRPRPTTRPLPVVIAPSAPSEATRLSDPGQTERTAPPTDAAGQLLAAGKKYEARALLTRQVLVVPDGPIRENLRKTLNAINAELFFSRAPSPDSTVYEVQPGDSLSRIATKVCKRDHYFHELIMRVNGIRDAKRIQAGQKLKIPTGTFSTLIQRDARRLTILLNGHYIKEYPVTVGAPATPTPLGKFSIANNKKVNPEWYSDGHVYKYGDPRNILGTRWVGFEETDQHQGYGIHGTHDPNSIGQATSNGCVRMLNEDVEEIFGMLMPGDSVEIVR